MKLFTVRKAMPVLDDKGVQVKTEDRHLSIDASKAGRRGGVGWLRGPEFATQFHHRRAEELAAKLGGTAEAVPGLR